MIKASYGTTSMLGYMKKKMDISPTIAYFMLGEKCILNCLYCTKASSSSSNPNIPSSTTWLDIPEIETYEKLELLYNTGKLKRACFSLVKSSNMTQRALKSIKNLIIHTKIPISLCCEFTHITEISRPLSLLCDVICISIDAVTNNLYANIKGNSLSEKLDLIEKASQKFPNKIATHLIVGLGETEYDMINMIDWLNKRMIKIGLFAFTPYKGTVMSHFPQPQIGSYRRIQIAKFLLSNHYATMADFIFDNNTLIKVAPKNSSNWKNLIFKTNGCAFRTTGCIGCNRPFHNELPFGKLYNYPRALTANEIISSIKESSI